MEDFLKDRPVLDPKSSLVIAADPKLAVSAIKPPSSASTPASVAGASPFGDLRRDPAASGAAARAGAKPAGPGGPPSESVTVPQAAAQNLKGEHGTKVQTVVERGRVTKIIVTCTCGKVTEIACQY